MVLQTRDMGFVGALGCCIKGATPTQWCRAEWPFGRSGLRACHKRLALLADAGLVTLESGLALTPERCQRSLACWCPGAPPPDLRAVHRQSSARWRAAKMRTVRVVQVTRAGAALVGGVTSVVRPSELGHDLALADAYFATLTAYPRVAALWQGEWMAEESGTGRDAQPGTGSQQGRFDAIIRAPGGPVMVELVGESYTLADLAELHATCARQEVRYQLW